MLDTRTVILLLLFEITSAIAKVITIVSIRSSIVGRPMKQLIKLKFWLQEMQRINWITDWPSPKGVGGWWLMMVYLVFHYAIILYSCSASSSYIHGFRKKIDRWKSLKHLRVVDGVSSAFTIAVGQNGIGHPTEVDIAIQQDDCSAA